MTTNDVIDEAPGDKSSSLADKAIQCFTEIGSTIAVTLIIM